MINIQKISFFHKPICRDCETYLFDLPLSTNNRAIVFPTVIQNIEMFAQLRKTAVFGSNK